MNTFTNKNHINSFEQARFDMDKQAAFKLSRPYENQSTLVESLLVPVLYGIKMCNWSSEETIQTVTDLLAKTGLCGDFVLADDMGTFHGR